MKRSDYASRTGRMYEVNINAKPEQFLDWDEATQSTNQPQAIQDQLPEISGLFDPLNMLWQEYYTDVR